MIRNLRNRMRLNTLAATFAVIFTMGAVFALSSGALDIYGRFAVTGPAVDPGFLVWESTDAFFNAAGGTAGRVPRPGTVTADGQRIAWNVEFEEPGVAILVADATNNGLEGLDIRRATPRWKWEAVTAPDDFGFEVRIDDDLFIGIVEPGDTTYTLEVEVEWLGEHPDGFVAYRPGTHIGGAMVGTAGTLIVEFEYVPVP